MEGGGGRRIIGGGGGRKKKKKKRPLLKLKGEGVPRLKSPEEKEGRESSSRGKKKIFPKNLERKKRKRMKNALRRVENQAGSPGETGEGGGERERTVHGQARHRWNKPGRKGKKKKKKCNPSERGRRGERPERACFFLWGEKEKKKEKIYGFKRKSEKKGKGVRGTTLLCFPSLKEKRRRGKREKS